MRLVEFTARNKITLLHCGAEYFPALIAAFDQARFDIYLETYIFTLDRVGVEVRDALIRAARRGVTVNVVTDWLGSGHRESTLLNQQLTAGGVNHHVFNAFFRRGIARTHRKMSVVDRHVAFLGGLNINDDHISDDGFSEPLPAPRWDIGVSITGPLVATIHRDMQAQWLLLGGLHLRYRWELFRERRLTDLDLEEGPALAALVLRDNLRNRRTIQQAYLKALGSARKTALLANPYFAPGRKLRDGLASAAARGVNNTPHIGVGQFRMQNAVAHSFSRKLTRTGM